MAYKIAVDGPAGCGKTTVAKIIAKKNNLLFISSGKIYRICAYLLNDITNLNDKQSIIKILDANSITYEDGIFYLNQSIPNFDIDSEHIATKASLVAKNKIVRNYVNKVLYNISNNYDVIIDGRDIGTVVLPDANLKFFLTASSNERAKRRKLELQQKNIDIKLGKIRWQIFFRDLKDKTRKNSPLKKAKNAIVIKTDNKSIDEVVDLMQTNIDKNK